MTNTDNGEHNERREAVHLIARLLRVALVAFLVTQIPRPRLGEIAAAGSRWTLLISLLLAALVLVTAVLAAAAERVRNWLAGWIW